MKNREGVTEISEETPTAEEVLAIGFALLLSGREDGGRSGRLEYAAMRRDAHWVSDFLEEDE